MKAKEKVAQYLENHIRPVCTKTIADYYLLSKSTVQKALQELEHEGKIIRTQQKSFYFWAWKRQEPVAVPAKAVGLSNTPAYNRPIQNSYPLARGYDD